MLSENRVKDMRGEDPHCVNEQQRNMQNVHDNGMLVTSRYIDGCTAGCTILGVQGENSLLGIPNGT